MRRYRRNREGSIFFFTLVTHQWREILITELGRRALREAIQIVRKERPFQIQAIVLLPDHLHAVWELPRNDNDYSTCWRLIKSRFTRRWIQLGGECGLMTSSRQRSGEQAVWQRGWPRKILSGRRSRRRWLCLHACLTNGGVIPTTSHRLRQPKGCQQPGPPAGL